MHGELIDIDNTNAEGWLALYGKPIPCGVPTSTLTTGVQSRRYVLRVYQAQAEDLLLSRSSPVTSRIVCAEIVEERT